jgi:uncharacterized protein (TIGR02300 family)
LATPELGAKQLCPNCQAKFYDLNRRPAHCPKCEHDFDPEEVLKSRRVRTRATPNYGEDEAEDQVKGKAEGEEDEEEEEAVTPEIDEAAAIIPPLDEDDDEVEVDGEPAGGGVGIVEDDEDAVLDDAEDDDSVPFLEEEGEDDDLEIDIGKDDEDR